MSREKMMTPSREIIDCLRKASKILLVSHISPDFDTMGSMLAMGLALLKTGKDITLLNVDGVPPNMVFLPGADRVVDKIHPRKKFDATLFCDAGTSDRFGSVLNGDRSRLGCIINLDHHLNGDAFADMEFVDSKRASTAELVVDLIRHYPIELDYDIAFNAYCAIVSDTGSFRYSNTNQAAFNCASEMMAYGINAWDVTTRLYENRTSAEMRLLAQALTTLEVSSCGRYASLVVTREAFKQTGAEEYMLDGFVNFPRSIGTVEVAILLCEKADGESIKISFRSKGRINVAAVAKALGGGGHHNAAGCTIKGDLAKVKKKLYRIVEKKLID